MPYIITTHTPDGFPANAMPDLIPSARRAVATLDAVQLIIRDAVAGRDYSAIHPENVALTLPESGGTIGPLPDGTVIEVRPVGWDHFGRFAQGQARPIEHRAILAAFNADA